MRIIRNKKWYTPMEIAKLGLIQTRKGDKSSVTGNYKLILHLIHTGQLGATNYSKGDKLAQWLVPEINIELYNQEFGKVVA